MDQNQWFNTGSSAPMNDRQAFEAGWTAAQRQMAYSPQVPQINERIFMGIAHMQDTNALSRQLADCCCENRQSIAQVRYDMATDACAIKTAIHEVGQQIVQNDNANFRALSDRLTQQEIDRLKAQLADKDLLINQLNLGISQRNQTENIVSQLKGNCCCNYACN